MEVNIKKLCGDAVIPQYAKSGDAGLDLVATSMSYDEMGNVVYGTGLAFEIPEGYVGLVFPRSSNSKKNLWLTNAVGVIDSGYRGEVTFKYRASLSFVSDRSLWERIKIFVFDKVKSLTHIVYTHDHKFEYQVGDRIGQIIIMPYPSIKFVEVDELSDSDRGFSGYGSTGK